MLDSAYIGHTNQNRFLLFDFRSSEMLPSKADIFRLSHTLCTHSIVDDILVLDSSTEADARFRIFGGDGREGDFCCNGALLAIFFLGYKDTNTANNFHRLELNNGICTGFCQDKQPYIQINLVQKAQFHLQRKLLRKLNETGAEILGCRTVAGEPHLIISPPSKLFKSPFSIGKKLQRLCKSLRNGCKVAGGANVTMVASVNKQQVQIATFERGANRITESCGSGSLSAASVLLANGCLEPNEIEVASRGGKHRLSYNSGSGFWQISGTSQFSSLSQLRESHTIPQKIIDESKAIENGFNLSA